MSVTDILKSEFNILKTDLITQYDAQGMRASGRTANSLEVIASGLNVKLLGSDVFEQLEYGRSPNNGSSGKSWDDSVGDIEQWIRDKGLESKLTGKMTISTLAFLIARKIWRQGWDRKNFGGVELISKVVTAERIQDILDKVGTVVLAEFQSEISNLFKTQLA